MVRAHGQEEKDTVSPVAIDTLLVAQQFQDAGFNRKQAAGAAQILAGLLTERAGREDTAAALSLIGAKIESLEKRHGAKLDALEAGQAGLRSGMDRMEAMMVKFLDGQAVLLQNDMDLKRRLDERR